MSYDISELDGAYGRPEALRRIKDYHEQHSCGVADAIEMLTRQLHEKPSITDGQVRTALAVLRAYTAGEMNDGDRQMLTDFEEALEEAYSVLAGDITCEIEDDPITLSY